MRPVLITPEEVIYHASTKHNIDPRTIEQAIIVAEERFIRPAIGYEFYEYLAEQKNTEVTSDNIVGLQSDIGSSPVIVVGDTVNSFKFLTTQMQRLWKMHLWKLTAECVMLLAFPDGFVQFSSEGVIHSNPTAGPLTSGNIITPELRAVKWAMDKKLMDRIDPLQESMHQWVCKNKADYPLYDKECDCDAKGIAYKRKTDFVLGIYDEETDCGC